MTGPSVRGNTVGFFSRRVNRTRRQTVMLVSAQVPKTIFCFFSSATLFPLAFIPLGILTCLFPSEFHTTSSPLLYLIWRHRPSSNACLGYPLGRFDYLMSFLALHVCSCSLFVAFFLPHSLHVSPLRAFLVSDLLCCMLTESRSLSCWRNVVRARDWQNCRYSQSPCSKLLVTSKIPFCAS